MFDPAALGSLKIGLDAADAATPADQPRPTIVPRRQPGFVRLALASALRRVAATLDARPVGNIIR